MPTSINLLIIGIGNAFRQDDAAGLLVVRRLGQIGCPGATVIEHDGDGSSLMAHFESGSTIILVDAAQSGAAPGTIHEPNIRRTPLPAFLSRASSHQFGVAEAIEMARALNTLPEQMHVFAIEGKHFGYGSAVSPEVQRAVERVCEHIFRLARSQAR